MQTLIKKSNWRLITVIILALSSCLFGRRLRIRWRLAEIFEQ